ncbi:MAG: hypothetical protein WAO20_13380 [Acidobacteriota bacterium]
MKVRFLPFLMALLGLSLSAPAFLVAAKKPTVEEIIEKHLKGLTAGDPAEMTKPKAAVGQVKMKVITGSGEVQGKVQLVSAPDYLQLKMAYPDPNYKWDGFTLRQDKEIIPEQITPNNYGFLADFFYTNKDIVRSGFVGGVDSSAWPFLQKDRKVDCDFDGEEKVDGDKTYKLKCKVNSLITATLYFDQKSYRLLQTVYRIPPTPQMSTDMGDVDKSSQRTDKGNAILTSRFKDYNKVGDHEFAARWLMDLEYRGEGSLEVKWEIVFQNVVPVTLNAGQ